MMIKILYVEDNEDDFLILRGIMGKIPGSPYALANANSIQNALDYLSKEKVDLIFLDLGLPGFSGKDAFGKLVDKFPDIPVIIMSGNEDKNVAYALIALGAVCKPAQAESKIDRVTIAKAFFKRKSRRFA